MYYYTIYGLTIATPVPFQTPLFLARLTPKSCVDLELSLALASLWTRAEWEASAFVSHAEPFGLTLRVSNNRLWFAFLDKERGAENVDERATLQWAIEGNQLRCFVAHFVAPAYLEFVLLDIILPKYLQLRGKTLFHAAVIEVDGCAVLLTAPTGTGKSTLTLQMSQLGARFMADDLAVVSEVAGVYEVAPSYPKSRLLEDSVMALGVTSRVETPKHVIEGYDWAAFYKEPAPLGAIYVLNRNGIDTDIQISALKGHRGLLRLLFAMQDDTPFPLPDIRTQQRDMAFMLRLMQRIPTRLLTYPSNYEQVKHVAARLLDDLRTHCL